MNHHLRHTGKVHASKSSLEASGWLSGVRHQPSPNYNQRPAGAQIDLLVIHNISLPAGEFGTGCVEQLFTNCLDCNSHPSFSDLEGVKVSSHLLIDRAGQIIQFVPLHLRAWHAGDSSFQGRTGCNDFSIGVELEGTDHSPYTERQYESLQQLSRNIMALYPLISTDNIVGHSDIAPSRKTDPGEAFDWQRYLSGLKS